MSRHARHVDVQYDQIVRGGADDPQGFFPARCLIALNVLGLQRNLGQFADWLLIVNDQQPMHPPALQLGRVRQRSAA